MNQNTTHDASEDARPDVACSALLDRGGEDAQAAPCAKCEWYATAFRALQQAINDGSHPADCFQRWYDTACTLPQLRETAAV